MMFHTCPIMPTGIIQISGPGFLSHMAMMSSYRNRRHLPHPTRDRAGEPFSFFPRGCYRLRRRAVMTLELILVLPIMLIVLLATIQFGQYFANLQELTFAARVGAQEAAQTPALPAMDGNPVPTSVITAIDQQLSAFGINERIIVLEHNTQGTPVSLVTPTGTPTPPKLTPLPPGRYVRVVIVVPKSEMMPELLKTFGLCLAAGQATTVSAVFPYEL